jgi:AcrR family transcriptional regulator
LRRDAERNRQRILDAARRMFAERGLEASLDDVAHAAGVGVGTVYRRFPNKARLVEALFEQGVDELVTEATAAAVQPDSWRALVTLVEMLCGPMSADRAFREVLLGSPLAVHLVVGARDRVLGVIAEVVERAKADGTLRPDVEPGDIAAINMMLAGAADLWGSSRPDLWRRYLGIILDGLRTDTPSPLPAPPVTPTELDELMRAGVHYHRRRGTERGGPDQAGSPSEPR